MSGEVAAAWIGLLGVVLGILGAEWRHSRKNSRERRLEAAQKKRLGEHFASGGYDFVRLETLAHIIGADEATTQRLLIELGGRASSDGQLKWTLGK